MTLYLADDGTLDTVFYCDACEEEIRYSSEGVERDAHGDVPEEEMERVSEEHAEHCGEET